MPSLICPLCRQPIQREQKTWRCQQGHSFDVAREGYVNLLMVQQKKSKEPGDNPEMVQARREFLQADNYAPLRDAVTTLLAPLNAQTLLDIGCGEGDYTRALTNIAADVTGLDIAKPAIQLAAKKFPNITWLVGSSALLPVADASVDIATSLFSPIPVNEMARVLRAEGYALIVRPADTHLWTVREALFGDVRAHQPDKFLEELTSAFTLVSEQEVRFPLALSQQSLKQLLAMTPYVWKAKPERRTALELNDSFTTEAAFSVMLLRKTSPLSSSLPQGERTNANASDLLSVEEEG